ncbi:MAG: enoyl-CoA hydratase/isomerase family protein [Promethearchaeota archaeon]
MGNNELVHIIKEDDIAILQLKRYEKRNALNSALLEAIRSSIEQLSHDPVKGIIITGANDAFSAGIDYMELASRIQEFEDKRNFRLIIREMQTKFSIIENVEKPIIAALNGYCYGSGLELALACDFRVAVTDVKIGMLETQLNLIPDLGGTTRLVRTVGVQNAKRIIMLAEKLDAQEAKNLGLIDWIVDQPSNLIPKAKEILNKIKENGPLAVGLAKILIHQVYGHSSEFGLNLERMAQSHLIDTSDLEEAFMAKLEKRKPVFKAK